MFEWIARGLATLLIGAVVGLGVPMIYDTFGNGFDAHDAFLIVCFWWAANLVVKGKV